ncbi:hypothetical protein [Burkholderia sp. A1]|uniref:hypothetical protein n=1 Tax=Burkholderia sp. A1 TaxID=148446 RepID=UPI001268D2A8|nr:hypothetical protein [Burkholderia sp. A1]
MKKPDIAKVCTILQRGITPVGVVSKTAWTDFYPDQKDCQSSFDLNFLRHIGNKFPDYFVTVNYS